MIRRRWSPILWGSASQGSIDRYHGSAGKTPLTGSDRFCGRRIAPFLTETLLLLLQFGTTAESLRLGDSRSKLSDISILNFEAIAFFSENVLNVHRSGISMFQLTTKYVIDFCDINHQNKSEKSCAINKYEVCDI
jgi:hypothetical protein